MNLQLTRVLLLGLGCTILASADQVEFSLTTSVSETPPDLTFFGNSGITGTTNNAGFLALSDLGTFTLNLSGQDVNNYNGDTFTLNLFFTAPHGIQGGNTFKAVVTGQVQNENQSSLVIDFGPTKTFTFVDGSRIGGFDLTIDEVTLRIPHNKHAEEVTQVLTGSIKNAWDPVTPTTVPEPVSIVLLGTATVLIAAKFRGQTRKS